MLSAKKNKLLYNFFSLGAVQAVSSLIQLIVIPHVIGRIGVDGYGVIAVAQVVMFYFAVFTDYSFNQTATRDIALYKANHAKIVEVFSTVLFSKLLLCGVAFIVLLILIWLVPFFKAHMLLYCMAFVFVMGQSLLINWFFLGMERMHYITFAMLTGRILFAILVFLFIREKNDDFLFLFFLGLGNVLAALISIILAFRIYKLKMIMPPVKNIIREIKEGWQITISHLSNSTCHYANVFILSFFASDLVVGYYSIAERIFFTIKQAFVVFSQAVYPRVCQLIQEGKEQALSFLKRVYSGFLLLVILGCLGLFIFSPDVLYFFMGNENRNAVFFLRVFSIIAVIVCLNIPGTLILLATNQKKSYLRVYAVATLVNIILNVMLAQYFQATGTVISIFITEFLITIGLTRIVYNSHSVKGRLASDPPDNVGY